MHNTNVKDVHMYTDTETKVKLNAIMIYSLLVT